MPFSLGFDLLDLSCEGEAEGPGAGMWRVGGGWAAAGGGASVEPPAQQRGREAAGAEGPGAQLGVMVCGGAAAFDEEAGGGEAFDDAAGEPTLAAPARSPPRRVVNVGYHQYSALPTLPARRALLSGDADRAFVDNTPCVGAATTVVGSHFGASKAQPSPVARVLGAVTASADVISNNKPVRAPTHLEVLNKLAGLADDGGGAGGASREWRSAYTMPKAPGGHAKGRCVLAPASLGPSASPKQDRTRGVPPQSPATAATEEADDDAGSRPTSASLCSSSGSEEDGSEDGGSEDDAAGVFGAASTHRAPPTAEHDGAAGRSDFCLGIRWFIRNNKLVVGSFSGWSVADKMGIKHGDILRAVDGVEVLNMVADADGNHPARELLKGVYGSKCKLHVMRVDAGQVKEMMNRPGAAAGKEKLILHDVHVEIPRLIASDPSGGSGLPRTQE